jgi:hypothetical protein
MPASIQGRTSLQQGLVVCAYLALAACSSSNNNNTPDAATGGSSAGAGNGGAGKAGGSAANGGKGGSAGKAPLAGSGGTAANGGGGGRAGQSGRAGRGGSGPIAGNTSGSGGNSGSTSCSGGAVVTTDNGLGAASVLERNNHPSRDGHFIQPDLCKAAAGTLAKDSDFAPTFTGNVYSSPLYVEQGPNGKGAFIVTTTSNDVFAFDETTGATLWTKNIGSSPSESGAGCGSVKPIGIESTPVIDAASRTLFVAGAIGTSSITRHELHALSLDDGTERDGWPLDVTKVKDGDQTFSPQPENQRSALSLVDGTVYVAYGGHVGDCGNYHGWVVGVKANDPTMFGGWATLGTKEGIWAAGGMASDGTGVFAVTGNGSVSANMRASSDSEQVVRITGLGTLDRQDKNLYFPMSWSSMDSQDADFGASNPIFVNVPDSTPASYVVAIAKDGHMYVLDSTNLGGMAGHIADFTVASGGAMVVRTIPAAYTSASGTHVVFSTASATGCPGAGSGSAGLMSVLLQSGSPVKPKVAWCAPMNAAENGPIVTTTDGKADPIVWYLNGNKLVGLDGETGTNLFTSSDSCTNVRKWTSPIAVKGRIVVAGDNHMCSWSPH